MARDYYAEAHEICSDLISVGRADLAEELTAAIEQGASATEILTALRSKLGQAIVSEPHPGQTELKMRSLKDALDGVLS